MKHLIIQKIKKSLLILYDTFIWAVFFSTVSLLIVYLSLPIVTYYFSLYRIESLSKDFNKISNKTFKKRFWLLSQTDNNQNRKISIINTNNINTNNLFIKNKIKDSKKYKNLIKLKNLITKMNQKKSKINQNKLKGKNYKDNNNNIDNHKKIDSNNSVLDKFPVKDLIFNSKKIYINWSSSTIVYKDIKKNIQRYLWTYSVISDFYWTPIIFTHSSGWRYNFWLYYLDLQKGEYIYLEWTYNWIKYYIEGIVKAIQRNIPWNKLYNWLVDVRHKNNFNKDKTIFLDTCELNWTKRRVITIKINKIYMK